MAGTNGRTIRGGPERLSSLQKFFLCARLRWRSLSLALLGITGVALPGDAPAVPSLVVPSFILEGSGALTNAANFRLGALATSNVVVTLQSSDPALLSVPETVTVALGQTNALFSLVVADNETVTNRQQVTIIAHAPGYGSSSNTLNVWEDDVEYLRFSPISWVQTTNTGMGFTLYAEDAAGNRLTNYYGRVALTATGLEGVLPLDNTNSGNFAGGQRFLSVTVLAPGRAVRISAPPAIGQSDAFNVGLPPFAQSTQIVADIVWHEPSQNLFATVPANGGVYSNRIVTINPITGVVLTSHSLGSSDPGQMEVSPEGNWVYVAISNQTALQRFDLNSRVVGAKFALGPSSEPVRFAYDFCVPSGLPNSVVVETRDRDFMGNTYRAGIRRYDSGVPVSLPNFDAAGGWLLESLPSSSQVLISPNLAKGNAATGTILATATNGTPTRMKYRDGHIYDEAGGVYAADTLNWLGRYPGVLDQSSHTALSEVNLAQRRLFYLSGFPPFGSGSYKLKVYDQDLWQPLYALAVPGSGGAPLGTPVRLVRCGTNGLAYANSNGELWFIRPDLIQSAAPAVDLQLDLTTNTPTALVGADYQFTLTLSNAGPGIASLIRVTNTLPANVTVQNTSASVGSVVITNSAFTWNIAPLAAGASATLEVTVQFGIAGWQTNLTTALSFETDINPANNVATLPLYVELPSKAVGVFPIHAASEDLLYDPARDRLILSVGNNPGGPANGLMVMNPYTGSPDSFTELGHKPGCLARSEDNQFLYVSLTTTGLVRRLDRATLVSDLEFAVGTYPGPGMGQIIPLYAREIVVLPDNPNAVALTRVSVSFGGNFGVGIYDAGVVRPSITASGGSWTIELDRDSGALYGYDTFSYVNGDARDLYRYAIAANGITIAESYPRLAFGAGADFEIAAGQIFTTAGRIITPQPFEVSWLVAGAETATLVEPDAPANRIYYLVQTNGWQLKVHELDSRRWLGTLPIPNLYGTPTSLIRWGTNGLAFRTSSNQLFVIRTPFTQPEASADIAVQLTGPAGPVAVGEAIAVTVTVTNAGPAAASQVLITNRFFPSVQFEAVNPGVGSWSNISGGFIWAVPTLAAGTQATLHGIIQAGSTGVVTWTASAITPTPDIVLGDNTAVLAVSVGAMNEQESVALLNVAANDLKWSPALGRLLVAASNSTPNWAGGLLTIEPVNRTVQFETTLGGDVNRLAIADAGGLLHAAVDFGLNTLAVPDLDITQRYLLNLNEPRARIYDLEVLPGIADAVVGGSRSLNNNSTWLAVYDAGIRRTNFLNFNSTGFGLEFGTDPTLFYYQDHSAGGFRRYAVQPDGVALLDTDTALLPSSTPITMSWADGHLFTSPGILIDPFTRTRVGQATAITNNSAVCYDAAAGQAYYVSTVGSTARLQAIDKATLVATGSRLISGVTGQVASLVRWGTNGLAFRTTGGQVGVLRTELIPSGPPTDLALEMAALQPLGVVGSNFVYSISVTNGGPNAAPNSQVLFRISTNATATSAATSAGTWNLNGPQLVAQLGELPVGGTATVTVTIVPTQPGSLLAVASVTSGALDSHLANNAQSLTHAAALLLAPGATTVLAQTANDLAYNPVNERLYVSGAAGGVSVINPALTLVETNWTMPSAPTRLALSHDAQYLYAAFDAGRRVGRFITTSGALDLDFSLGTNGATPFTLVDFAAMPGNAQALAVTKQSGGFRTVQILDDGVLRPGVQLNTVVNHLEFGSNPDLLYGTGMRQFVIGPTNLTELGSQVSAVANENLEYADGYFYTTGGKRVEATSRVVVGNYAGLGTGTLVEPDVANGRVYFLTRLGIATGTWQIRAYDPATYAFLGNTTVTNVLGSPTNFVRWGTDGLAFSTTSSQVFLMRSSLAPTGPATDLAISASSGAGPFLVGSNLTFTLTITNTGPNNASNVMLINRYPTNAFLVNFTNSQGSVTQSLGTVTCLLSTLTNGASAQIQLTLRPMRAGPFNHLAVLTSSTSDPVITNNSAELTVPVSFNLGPDSFGVVDLQTTDLAYDPVSGLLYATPTNQPGNLAGSVVTIDPETGLLGDPFAVAPDLSQLSFSDDGSRLYVLANKATEFRRLNVVTKVVELIVPGAVSELEPVPGTSNSVIVTRPNGGVTVYDDSQARSNALIWFNQVEFYAPDRLLGFWSTTTPNWTARIALDSNGVNQASENAIYLVDGVMTADAGLIYTSGGSVIDPLTLTKIRSFGVTGPVSPQASLNRIAFVTGSGASTKLRVFDTLGLLERGALAITNAVGTPTRLLSCGADRFAFRTTGGQIIIVRSSAIPTGPAADLALGVSSSPSAPTAQQPFALTLLVTNLGPATATAVIVSNALPASLALVSANLSQGTITGEPPAILWHVGELAAGAVATNQLMLIPQAGGAFAAQSLVYGNAADSNALNDVAGIVWLVDNAPTMALSTLALSTGDLVWEPISQRLVMSVTAPAPAISNSLLRLDPVSGQFEPPIPVGPQPGKLAITDNGQIAYVGLDSNQRLLEVNLATSEVLTDNVLLGKLLEIELPPSNPDLVVTLQEGNLDAYLNGAELPLTGPLPWDGPSSLTRPNAAGRFYGYVGARNISFFTPTFYRMTVNNSGWVINDTFTGLLAGAETTIESAAGLVFASSGTVLQPETLSVITNLPDLAPNSLVCPDPNSDSLTYLTPKAGQWWLRQYSHADYSLTREFRVPHVSGTPKSLVRWGADGLAFLTTSNQLYLLRPPLAVADLALTHQGWPTQAIAGQSFQVILSVTNHGPATAADAFVTNTPPALTRVLATSASQGQVILTNNRVIFALGDVDSQHGVNLTVTLLPTNILTTTLTNSAVGTHAFTELAPASNSSDIAFVALADRDLDGMPDNWELAYGFNPTNALDAAWDSDCDGWTNLQEHQAGRNPIVFENMRLTEPRLTSAGQLLATMEAQPGRQFTVEASTNLSSWQPMQTGLVRTQQQVIVLAPKIVAPAAFFRLRMDTNAPLPVLTLVAPASATNRLSLLQVNALPGRNYTVQSSTNLTHWLTVTNYFGLDCLTTLAVPVADPAAPQFYRILQP
jgi:uncharacterized repeat protein (TIGR01451 family)